VKRSRHSTVPASIARREEFRASNITGTWQSTPPGAGWLPPQWYRRMVADFTSGQRIEMHGNGRQWQVIEHVYVVMSYATAIAWWTERTGWVAPDVWYSPTTWRHQGLVRAGIGAAIEQRPQEVA
jgi:hypothetical protein